MNIEMSTLGTVEKVNMFEAAASLLVNLATAKVHHSPSELDSDLILIEGRMTVSF